MKILITGGAGFIGSALVRHMIRKTDCEIVNVDKLTYAANPLAVEEAADDPRYALEVVDICDTAEMKRVFRTHRPAGVIHLAAESHVDRSIDDPEDFIQTNLVGTYRLLEVLRVYWEGLSEDARRRFRLHHVSTDEVFGSLGSTDLAFDETTRYAPNSPYSASKAGADHLVRAWHHTYGLPVVMSNCSNNYGPWQFPEKLIPLMIAKALSGERLPIYGGGENVRDWVHVDDHAAALWRVFSAGDLGSSYNIGGRAERSNIEVVRSLCRVLDDVISDSPYKPHETLIDFVTDRPGHDFRYAMNIDKIESELGWYPEFSFEDGIRSTVRWYLDNQNWWEGVLATKYAGDRLGLAQGQ